jgi:hypothetical protein
MLTVLPVHVDVIDRTGVDAANAQDQGVDQRGRYNHLAIEV